MIIQCLIFYHQQKKCTQYKKKSAELWAEGGGIESRALKLRRTQQRHTIPILIGPNENQMNKKTVLAVTGLSDL